MASLGGKGFMVERISARQSATSLLGAQAKAGVWPVREKERDGYWYANPPQIKLGQKCHHSFLADYQLSTLRTKVCPSNPWAMDLNICGHQACSWKGSETSQTWSQVFQKHLEDFWKALPVHQCSWFTQLQISVSAEFSIDRESHHPLATNVKEFLGPKKQEERDTTKPSILPLWATQNCLFHKKYEI